MLDWEWYDDIPTKVLFFHLLLTVNYEEKKWRGQTIKAGQIITSLAHLSEQTMLSARNIRTSIEKLEKTGELTRQTTNRFTILTLVKWDEYQSQELSPTSQLTNKRQTNDKQTTTTKEVKKERKKEETHAATPGVALQEPKDTFLIFWDAYPRKVSKLKAMQIWKKIKPTEDTAQSIMEGLERAKRSSQWIKDGGQFVPHPATWLNQERWNDEETHLENRKIEKI